MRRAVDIVILFSLMVSAMSLSASAQSQNTWYLHASYLLDQNAPTGTTANALKLTTGVYYVWKSVLFSAQLSFPAGAWTAAVWMNMTQGPTQYRVKLGTVNRFGGFVEYAHSFTPIVTSASPARYEVSISVGVFNVPAGESLAMGFLRQWQNGSSSPAAFIFFDSQAMPSSITGPAVPAGSFTIEANPTSRTVYQGDSTTYTITVRSFSGFNLPVTLGVTGLPLGATGNFSPPSLQPPLGSSAQSTLTVTVPTTPVGTYALNITGTDTSSPPMKESVIVTLNVIARSGDLSVCVSPNTLTMNKTDSKTAIVTVTSIGQFNENVTLSVTGLPAHVTATFTPPTLKPSAGGTATSIMRISVGADAINGTYHLLITAGNGTFTRDTTMAPCSLQFFTLRFGEGGGPGVPGGGNVGFAFAFIGIGLGIAVAGVGVAFALSGQRGSEVIVYGGYYYCRKHRVPLWYAQGWLWCPVERRYLRP